MTAAGTRGSLCLAPGGRVTGRRLRGYVKTTSDAKMNSAPSCSTGLHTLPLDGLV